MITLHEKIDYYDKEISFCSATRNKTASVILGNVEYKFTPPITVSVISPHKTLEVRYNNFWDGDSSLFSFSQDETITYEVRREVGNGVDINNNQVFRNNWYFFRNSIPVNLNAMISMIDNQDFEGYNPALYTQVLTDNNNYEINFGNHVERKIFSFASMPKLKVKCDNCEPELCEATNDYYPGYICLDCEDLNNKNTNLQNIIKSVK